MRYNLDPTDNYSDQEIEELLLEAQLDKVILKKKKDNE
jgi:hypothetical protein